MFMKYQIFQVFLPIHIIEDFYHENLKILKY